MNDVRYVRTSTSHDHSKTYASHSNFMIEMPIVDVFEIGKYIDLIDGVKCKSSRKDANVVICGKIVHQTD